MVKFILAAVLLLVTVDFAVDRGAYTLLVLHAAERGIRGVAHSGEGSLWSW